MKPFAWITVTAVLLVGVGWTSRVLTESWSDPSSTKTARKLRHHSSPDFRRVGPYLANVGRFADELGLDDAQRERLDALVEDTTREVRQREHALREYLYATRAKVEELLTDAQKKKLAGLNERKWAEFRAAKLERALDWFRSETALDQTALAKVEEIWRKYEDDRAQCFRTGDPRSRSARKEQIQKLVEERNSLLEPLLSAEEFERFQRSGLDRRRGSRGDRRGGRNGWRKSGPETRRSRS